MKADPLGERSLIIRELNETPVSAAAKFKLRLPGLQDAVPCYGTVGLYFSENVPSIEMLQHALEEPLVLKKSTLHTIPVCYELEQDLSAAAIELGVSIQTLVHLHCSKTYICSTVGFVPGFAYLGDLAPEIATLKRLSTPRISVDAGSVAIAGKQTAVYPTSTPGGWWIIGKTPLMLVNEAEGYFPIAAGDRVTFRRIGRDEFETMRDCRL